MNTAGTAERPAATERAVRTLVVCAGNDLAADDGLGPAVYRELRTRTLPPGTRVFRLGVASLALLDELAAEDLLLLVDAVQLGGAPGTLHVLPWDRLPACAGAAVSLHGIGLRETLAVGQALFAHRMPRQATLLGVEGRCFDQLGAPLSPPVEAALPAVLTEIEDQIERCRSHPAVRSTDDDDA